MGDEGGTMWEAWKARAGRRGTVRVEQAVYGSFPFRDQGYAMLARSPGCREEWLVDFRAACQKLGERPLGSAEAASLFAIRLPSGPWAVVGVSPQGRDDRGRPGALAFHGLFLSPAGYRKAGCDPFALAGLLRHEWSAEANALPTIAWPMDRVEPEGTGWDDPRVAGIVRALTRGRRVALEEGGPVEGLAREVWRALPMRVRGRASLATWAFGNANRFDLLAAPKLAGLALDSSYVAAIPAAGEVEEAREVEGGGVLARRGGVLAMGLGAVVLGVAGVGWALRGDEEGVPAALPTGSARVAPPVEEEASDEGPAERRRGVEAVSALADRFGVGLGDGGQVEPADLLVRLDRGLRYRGPFLSEADRARLAGEPGHDPALALLWDERARRFADDRALPADFRGRSLRGQILAVAWAFHCEGEVRGEAEGRGMPRRGASELAQALGEALAVDVPLRTTPLAGRFPALGSYVTFLGKLPRR